MTSGSIGSHRAFMGVCITLCVCLALVLFVGWRLYFFSIANRNTLIEIDQTEGKKVQDLEKMGLSFESVQPEAPAPSVLPKILASGGESNLHFSPSSTSEASTPAPAPTSASSPAPSPALASASSSSASASSGSAALFPAESSIKELPLLPSSDEVVQAVELLDRYWKTKDWQERVPLVAHSDRVARLMKDFYETQKGADPVPGALTNKARYQIDGTEILYFSYASNRPTGSLEIAMLKSPEGKFLIDWESLTGYGEMSFQEFRAQRPTKPVLMRAYVRLFEYYNFEFSDAKKYLCVKMTSESGESSVYGYCERGTKLANWLDADLATTGPSGFKGYTMLLSFPANAQSNQCVNLEKVLAQRWLRLP
ncbi:hypothetical protein [Prosthecobacter sp.]|uniref:hypothetical protein n=1 Tax=Prosthecobacter sp. TaxID=1965333 RepID=UPI0037848EC4